MVEPLSELSQPKPSCSYESEWGRCQQPTREGAELCSFHSRLPKNPDRRYHEKVVRGLLQPSWDVLSDVEANALFHGRFRGDGRRLDAYVLPDEAVMDEEA